MKSKSTRGQLQARVRSHVIPNRGISNTLVDRLCTRVCRGGHYVGCYAADRLPMGLTQKAVFIVIANLGPSLFARKRDNLTMRGGHFVTIVATTDQVRYIDPFGIPSISPYVETFLTTCNRPINVNLRQIQSFDSPFCGFYAILFAAFFDEKFSNNSKRRLQFFEHPHLEKNDALCEAYLYEMISGK